jgi:hypothetical protein
MNLSRTLISTGMLAILAGVASPALAEHHGGSGGQNHGGGGQNHGGGQSRGAAVSRGGSQARAPQGPSAQRTYSGGAQRAYSGAAPRPYSGGVQRAYSGGAQRAYSGSAQRAYSGGQRAYSTGVPRAYSGVRGFGESRGVVQRGFGSRFGFVGPARFFRPYYAFRPRLSLGFGLWAGYPIAYSYAYYDPFYDPYAYGYPPAYPPYDYAYPATTYPAYPPASGYPASAPPPASSYPSEPDSIGVQPGQGDKGGLSFEVTPSTAQVFVDGTYVGTVGQFTPTSQPLGLTAGRHQVEIRAPGYRTISFNSDIVAGQVVPYQGSMER